MLKLYFLIFTLLVVTSYSWSQTSLTEDALPKVGDSLRTVTDPLPPALDLGHPGADNNWNFSKLQGISSERIVLDAESEEGSTPIAGATFRIAQFNGAQHYLRTRDGQQLLLGMTDADPTNMGFKASYTFDPPYPVKNIPLSYDDEHTSNSSIQIKLPAADLSQEILDRLSSVEIDSIRLQIDYLRRDEVDAWGYLTIPNGGYEVIREKRIEYTTPKLEILSFLGWIDVTLLATTEFPALAKDTSFTYHFWSDQSSIPIAEVAVDANDENQILSATYLANSLNVDIPYVRKDRKDLIAFPNPAIDKVRFNFRNLPPDYYDLVIFNILGQELWSQSYYVSGNHTVEVDITNIRKGTYLYSLVHNKDKTLVTKRLMVIRP